MLLDINSISCTPDKKRKRYGLQVSNEPKAGFNYQLVSVDNDSITLKNTVTNQECVIFQSSTHLILNEELACNSYFKLEEI